jgi:membrane-bound metal-dependent hydrolase YbcI (DUF457 family)
MIHPTTLIDVMLCTVGMIAVGFGSLTPDIDIKQSMIRKWYVVLPTLPFWITQLSVHWLLGTIYGFKHRGVMHSLMGWATSFAAIAILTDLILGRMISVAICGGFAFGYLLHLIEDAVTTKKRIDWLPAPRFMKSRNIGLVLVLLLLLAPLGCVAAAEPTPTIKYFFSVFIVTLIAGIGAATGSKTLAIRLVQGIIVSFVIVYVLPGILFGWTI